MKQPLNVDIALDALIPCNRKDLCRLVREANSAGTLSRVIGGGG